MAAASTGASIPRTIHQIWLGRNPEPRAWTDTVRAFAKEAGWDYKLWDETAVRQLDFDCFPGLAALYHKFGKELAGRADLIRYVVLYKYGGVYIDADCVIRRPDAFANFFEANEASMFFAWERVPARTVKKYNIRHKTLVANSIIGASPSHPFLEEVLQGVAQSAKNPKNKEAWMAMGPLYITKVYKRLRGKPAAHGVRVYPMRLFYPMHWKGIKDPEAHKKMRGLGRAMFFQYGYSTNRFAEIFRERRATRRQRRQRRA